MLSQHVKSATKNKSKKTSSRDVLQYFIVVRRPFLDPCWVHLGLSWALLGPWAILSPPGPVLGGPRGQLEANVGLGKLEWGVQGGKRM